MWFRLVDRDRRLLALLAEHKVLTTNQIAAIEFLSVRRAQDRLRHLRELGVVFAFRESYLRGGTSQTRYALGYLGARLIAAQRAERPPAPKAYAESLDRLALWPKLDHQLGVNDFFCALAAHRNPARLREAGREGEVSGLTQWWSEHRCTEFFWKYLGGGRETRLRPDGYGCWEEHGRTVRFFLEHDTGTESLAKVTGKLDDYGAFPTDAFGVLLFSVHSTRREIALRTALRRALAGHAPGFVIATAARDPHGAYGHADGPAAPIWGLWTPQSGDSVPRRYRLAELPQRGPSVEHSASTTDQPLNEAAFDPNDREMSRRIHTAQSEPADPAGYADDDDDLDDVTLYDDADDDDVDRAPVAPARPDPQRPRRTRWAA
ncbi:replication-relaxation family protein [Amycolatopsis benzoatilytica]|uniref:replication-relaxation family protein n=1 Tax=Amycolatopsis benzoatilytica TaxID=346045 RepID=UPI0003748D21|nr:replication-relaxation family protein [Amycolatopsis benzoatilytica]